VKLLSSLYIGTAESNFTKSKQPQDELDVLLAVFYSYKDSRKIMKSYLILLYACDRPTLSVSYLTAQRNI